MSPLLIVLSIVLVDLMGFTIVMPLLPRFADEYGFSKPQIGLLLAASRPTICGHTSRQSRYLPSARPGISTLCPECVWFAWRGSRYCHSSKRKGCTPGLDICQSRR